MKIYTIDTKYIDYLRTIDTRVPDQHKKFVNRPYVGIIVTENKKKYFIPLSSPKPKHQTMKNQLDFLKIDGGKLGVMNINNMIPVPDDAYTEIDIVNLMKNQSIATVKYGNLLDQQQKWIDGNENIILAKVHTLYEKYQSCRLPNKIKSRCLPYSKLESGLEKYNTQKKENNGLSR